MVVLCTQEKESKLNKQQTLKEIMQSCLFSKSYLQSLANCLTPVIQIQTYLRRTLLQIWLHSYFKSVLLSKE